MKLTDVDNRTGLAVCGGVASGVGSGVVEPRQRVLAHRRSEQRARRSNAGQRSFLVD